MKQLNWLGVVLGLVIGEIIGALWYGVVFSEKWMAEVHPVIDEANAARSMVLGILAVLVMVVALAWVISKLGWNTLGGGAKAGLIAALGLTAPGVLLDPIYAGRSYELMAIEAGYVIVILVIAGALIGGVRLPRRKVAAA